MKFLKYILNYRQNRKRDAMPKICQYCHHIVGAKRKDSSVVAFGGFIADRLTGVERWTCDYCVLSPTTLIALKENHPQVIPSCGQQEITQ